MGQELIYNQRKIPKEKWRYGLRASAAVGCGWIAAYNALTLMGYKVEPETLIRCFERQLPLIHGNTGTSFWGPALYFKQWGFPVEVTARRERFDELARGSDVSILFYHWREGLKMGAHFVAVTHGETGFVGYNTYRNSEGPDAYGESLEAFLRRRRWFGAVLIAIRDKRQGAMPHRPGALAGTGEE